MMRRLTADQLTRLDQHKYKSDGTSILEPYFQVYWRWLVTCVPLWLAPNLITFIGLVANLLTTIFVVLYDPNISGQAPLWVFLACAVSLFIYQSLDAIDGKQARRTGTNNPLGEFFDHGCDAVSNLLLIPCSGGAIALNEHPNLFISLIIFQMTIFYCYHWQSYVIGMLKFNKIDTTEAQLLIIAVEMVTYIGGVDVWRTVVFGKLELRQLVLAGVLVSGVITSVRCLVTILTDGQGKNGSTVADTSILSPLFPLVATLSGLITYSYWSQFSHTHASLYMMVFSVPMVKLSIVLVVSCMTKSPMPLVDSSMLAPLVAISNMYFGFVISEYLLFSLLTVFVLVDLMISCTLYCQDIASHLNVNIFTIVPKKEEK